MQSANIRQRLHQYVDNGDEKLLNLLYALAKEYNDEDDFEYEFSQQELQEIDLRRAKRISGESKTFNWKDAKEMITRKTNIE